ncbi:MAG TPA: outer membrane beta-barrel protein [Candidatus Eisenbacteria bacterium]|nr:outer membrane beta-barrel protein [Candidatus Eisenbacteria bacterium]
MFSTLRTGWIAVALSVMGGLFATAAQAGPPSMMFQAGYGKMVEDGAPNGDLAFHGNAFMMANPVIGVGAEGGYAWLGSTATNTAFGDIKTNVWHVTGNVRVRGVTGSIRPYGIGGLGVYGLHESDNTGSGSDTKFGFNIGGGLTHKFPDSSTGLSLEARWHMVSSVPNSFSNPASTTPFENSTLNMVTITAGVDFN